MWVRGRGNINVLPKLDGDWEDGVLENVLYVPDLKKDIFSMREAMVVAFLPEVARGCRF